MKSVNWHFPLLLIAGLSACSDSPNTVEPVSHDVNVEFAAKINGADFACGQTYPNVGSGSDNYQVNDFRFFVHEAHIHDHDSGETYTVELTQDGIWQHQNVALLDFETGCAGGTVETNTSLRGTAVVAAHVDASNTEFCFSVGVPQSLNHSDSATAPSPLNVASMQWNWLTGYKYIRIDGVGDPGGADNGFNIHLGAQGCPASDGGATAPPAQACSVPNTVEVCIDGFNIAASRVAVDAGRVLAGNDVSVNLNRGPAAKAGCMSFIDDDDCEEIMPRLGLDYTYGRSSVGVASTHSAGQVMFSRE